MAQKKYLDLNGLEYYTEQVKDAIGEATGVTTVDPVDPVQTDILIPTKTSQLENDSGFITNASIDNKQDKLVSGTNIKTINNQSLLGSGNINISGGSGGSSVDVQVNGTSIVSNDIANIVTETAYDSSTNKIATMSDVNNNKIEYTNASFLRTAALNQTAITSEQRSLIDSHNLFYLSRLDSDDGNLPTLYYRSTGYFKFDIGVTSIKFECGNRENYIFMIYRDNTVGMTSYNDESTSNKITSITSSSTDTQYPSAKAVYDLFTSITNGDEVSY